MGILEFFPMIADVKESYRRFREKGADRAGAIEKVKNEFAMELLDKDDGPQVWIGLAEATGRRRELTEELLQKAEAAFTSLSDSFPATKSVLRAKMKTVCDPSKFGPEAKYRQRTAFRVDWKIGDTFAYRIVGESMKAHGLDGWYIICRKVHDFVYSEDCCVQGMYYSLCPPNELPQTAEDLERLGYVPLLQINDDHYLFMGKVWVNSKNAVKKTFFIKIGNFPEVAPPAHEYAVTNGPHISVDQLVGFVDDSYFWCLERDVLEGYLKNGNKPAVQRNSPDLYS